MSKKKKDGTTEVISLGEVRKAKEKEIKAIPTEVSDIQKSIMFGIESFNEVMEDGIGFLAIAFDSNQVPYIIHAGDLELVRALGSLEVMKQELLTNVFLLEEAPLEYDQ